MVTDWRSRSTPVKRWVDMFLENDANGKLEIRSLQMGLIPVLVTLAP